MPDEDERERELELDRADGLLDREELEDRLRFTEGVLLRSGVCGRELTPAFRPEFPED